MTNIGNMYGPDFTFLGIPRCDLDKPETFKGADVIIVDTQKGGWLSFIDNWHPNWKVIINNKPHRIYMLFNAYKVVYITPGTSIVEFKFQIFE